MFRIRADRPDLVRAQAEALTRHLPVLYFILAINSAATAVGYHGRAPFVLAVLIPAGLGLYCLVRGILFATGKRDASLPVEVIVRRLRWAPLPAATLGFGFVGWGFALYPYGDDLMQLHLSFYMMATTLASALCLLYLPGVAVLLTAIVLLPCLAFDLMTGNATLILVAVNTLVIDLAMLHVLVGSFRTFEELVGARSRLERQNAEIAQLQERSSADADRRRLERKEDLERIAAAFSRSIESVTLALGAVSQHGAAQSSDVSRCSEIVLERLGEVRRAADGSERSLAAVLDAAGALGQSIEALKLRTAHASAISTTVEPRTASADDAMRGLDKTIRQIDTIATMIRTIAGQIDLIALNATIEAARAGSAGRSFAVVAAEIKTLAAQTAQATDEIARHVGEVKAASDAANTSVAAMRHGFLELRAVSDDIADALDTQTDVTGDILGHVERAVGGAASMRRCLDDMSATSDRTSSSARAMLGQSRVLREETDVLAREVTDFLGFIRAA